MSLDKKIEKIRKDLEELDKVWEERQEQLKQTFNQEFGVYMGRRHALQDVLKLFTEDEKNEQEPEQIEDEGKSTVNE